MYDFLIWFALGFLTCAILLTREIRNVQREARDSWAQATEVILDFSSRIEKLKQENK